MKKEKPKGRDRRGAPNPKGFQGKNKIVKSTELFSSIDFNYLTNRNFLVKRLGIKL
jgi:hypothetical protein